MPWHILLSGVNGNFAKIIGMNSNPEKFMKEAIRLAKENLNGNHGGPFGCVIVKNGEIIASAHNEVLSANDPTAHAEVLAIRRACEKLGTFQLEGCEIYTSCEPCPMCLGAIYWSRPAKVYYAASRKDAAIAGFDDHYIYDQMGLAAEMRDIPFRQMMKSTARELFVQWSAAGHTSWY